ncbi:MAG: hypothetical protein Q9227_001450 [Pyrenula ochraceoflavens]
MSADPPPRLLTLAAAQLGPIHLSTPLTEIQSRLLSLLESAASQGARLVVYPELSYSTFFSRVHYPTTASTPNETLESFFSPPSTFASPLSPSSILHPLLTRAASLNVDICIGLAECAGPRSTTPSMETQVANAPHAHYNTYIYYSSTTSTILSKYRKVHLPGTIDPKPTGETNQLEKRYFTPGDLGFEAIRVPNLLQTPAPDISPLATPTSPPSSTTNHTNQDRNRDPILGLLLCNDRRWPEAFRSLGLQGTSLILCGFNTTAHSPEMLASYARSRGKPASQVTREEVSEEALFHHRLCMQAGCYQNACFGLAVAKCGVELGSSPDPQGHAPSSSPSPVSEAETDAGALTGGTMLISPDGEVLAELPREMDGKDAVLVREIDLGRCERGKGKVFDMGRHRRVDAYERITGQVGVKEPD